MVDHGLGDGAIFVRLHLSEFGFLVFLGFLAVCFCYWYVVLCLDGSAFDWLVIVLAALIAIALTTFFFV